ncbi:hypothetical protein GSI_10005 [Ganoderma sinense ZZ0214-1]|uniref:Uncharacterized protein n=1 Tax=Ganoderma sinense ZZ0214-1 TaxID=1077348 RepID=A0A2G8S278_9APHY|nr:hypothetical protein GSI_10005 [Ganoderma sinense ZZ0214-1]
MPSSLSPFNPSPMVFPFLRGQSSSAWKLGVYWTRGRCLNFSIGRPFTTSKETLKPESTTPSATPQRSKPSRQRSRIRTLDPHKLVQDDYIDFSLKAQPRLGVVLQSRRSTDPLICRSLHNPIFTAVPWSTNKFPPGTHGFLYYHVPPNGSPLAGELRFRVTPTRDPASFATGSDLLTDRAMPWRYPLYKLVCRPSCQDLVALLLQDRLLSQRTLDLISAAVAPLHGTGSHAQRGAGGVALSGSSARQPTNRSTTPVLSAFGQEFCLRYTEEDNFLAIFASPDAILKHEMRFLTASQVSVHGKSVLYSPFKGSVVCCFEQSMLPKHAGKRVVVIRVVRMVESDPIRRVPPPAGVDYPWTEALEPRVGELLKKVHYGTLQPWAADVDSGWKRSSGVPRTRALKVLFENQELYGSPSLERNAV